jgi:AcrR family transcriptional regulator
VESLRRAETRLADDQRAPGAQHPAAGRPAPSQRRAPWSGRSPLPGAEGSREKIIEAAVVCIGRFGLERTSLSAIAGIAGVSRPTVYAYFDSREDLVSAAMRQAVATVTGRAVAGARRRARTAADFAVEMLVAARREIRAEPALYPIADLRGVLPWALGEELTDDVLAFARPFVAPVVEYDPSLAAHLDELTDLLARWLLSVVMFDSAWTATEPKLRAYLRRRVVPALRPD